LCKVREFTPVKNLAVEIPVGCSKIFMSPDFSFFLWGGAKKIHEVKMGSPYLFKGQDASLLINSLLKIKKTLLHYGIVTEKVSTVIGGEEEICLTFHHRPKAVADSKTVRKALLGDEEEGWSDEEGTPHLPTLDSVFSSDYSL